MIKGGFFNDGFGDLLRKLVEVPEILIPGGGVGSRGCGYTSISRLCRRMTAFIHYSLSLSLTVFSAELCCWVSLCGASTLPLIAEAK